MSDPLQKVSPGDPLKIPATAYNAFVDAARAVRQANRGGAGVPTMWSDRDVVLVKNGSGGDLDRFAILAISAPLFTPTDNLAEFKNRFPLTGATPTTADAGKFVILLAPCKSGSLAQALVAGVTPVLLEVVSSDHAFADVKASSTELKSGPTGSCQILWKESGTGTGKWAIVRVENASLTGGMFAVKVYKDGGVAGSASTNCTWTYTVKDFAGTNTLATTKTPLRPRYTSCQYDLPADGSYGLAFYDSSNTLQLYEAVQEKPTGDTVDYVTQLRVDGLTLQAKTRTALVLELGTESAWTTWHTGEECA